MQPWQQAVGHQQHMHVHMAAALHRKPDTLGIGGSSCHKVFLWVGKSSFRSLQHRQQQQQQQQQKVPAAAAAATTTAEGARVAATSAATRVWLQVAEHHAPCM
jgi:hypothetical protein